LAQTREQFQYEVKNELERHTEYNDKIKKELKSMKIHGGLGMSFVKKIKILIAVFITLILISGILIFILKPQPRGAYSISVLGVGLLASVFYLRKVQDNNME